MVQLRASGKPTGSTAAFHAKRGQRAISPDYVTPPSVHIPRTYGVCRVTRLGRIVFDRAVVAR